MSFTYWIRGVHTVLMDVSSVVQTVHVLSVSMGFSLMDLFVRGARTIVNTAIN